MSMKKVVTVTEVDGEGLLSLLGEEVVVWCMNYIYSGTLSGVNETYIKLDNAHIVYETGELNSKTFKDAQKLPNSWYINTAAIESFGKR